MILNMQFAYIILVTTVQTMNAWMSNLHENVTKKPINSIALPGTHNSGAYYLDESGPVSSGKPIKSSIIEDIIEDFKNEILH